VGQTEPVSGTVGQAEPSRVRAEAAEQEPGHRRWAGAILAAGMAVALAAAMISIPRAKGEILIRRSCRP